MQLKNLATGVALPLPDDLLWSDEHAWSPAVTSVSYLLTGALLVQSATRQAGRPITLVGLVDMAWVTRVTVATVLGQLAAGSSIDDLLADYPSLSRDDVHAALAYAAETLPSERSLVLT